MENQPSGADLEQPEASATGTTESPVAEPTAPPATAPTPPPPTYPLRSAPPSQEPLRLSGTERWLIRTFDRVNVKRPWHKLPTWVALLNFVALREQLRAENLHDTDALATYDVSSSGTVTTTIIETGTQQPQPSAPPDTTIRTQIGDRNDPHHAQMGAAMSRFGRNFPLADSYPDDEAKILQPNPREVSQTLLRRDSFVPATTLNLLAAAWIQFQTHDWFNHGDAGEENEWKLPVTDADPWYERTMRVPRTPADHTRADNGKDGPPTFLNKVSHWWDASSIYGTDDATLASLRSFEDGKMIVENNMLRLNPTTGVPVTGFFENWWVGLTLLHTLFTLEHNAICDRLRQAYPAWKDDRIFHTARLINAALMAKIHTVEWTPGILAHPALQIGMRANWWGLAGERLYQRFGRFSRSEAISGVVGSQTHHHGAPYSLTEEFTSVYRLHPLLPDEVTFRSAASGNDLQHIGFMEMAEGEAGKLIAQGLSMTDIAYTFGTRHPGAIQLHNYPRFLLDLTRPNGQRLDVGAVDILRDRERGVPRYNRFRELVHKPRVNTFDELTTNKQWAKEIAEVYDGDLDRVDLMVGLFAEPTPPGFGFSDTAFRIFILMATRRLKSDRFFTVDYRPEIYSPEGMKWIDDNNMRSVLVRHYPQLQPFLSRVNNAFAPWPR